MKKFLKRIVLLLGLSILFLVGVSLYIEKKFTHYKDGIENKSGNCEVWSHRGIINDSFTENTIGAFAEAKRLGVTGIEVDVFWIDSLQNCVVMHDLDSLSDLRKALSLDEVCAVFRDSLDYWIDFKNLSSTNANDARIYFKKLVTQMSLVNHLYIENGNPDALAQLKTEGLNTLFWIQFNRSNPIKKFLKTKWIQYKIAEHRFDGCTIASLYYDNTYQELFGQLPTYIFHGSYKNYQELCNQKGLNIKAVLVDQDYY